MRKDPFIDAFVLVCFINCYTQALDVHVHYVKTTCIQVLHVHDAQMELYHFSELADICTLYDV